MPNRNFRSGAYLLWLLREGKVHNWKGLCKELGLESKHFHTGHYDLRENLSRLKEAGLILYGDTKDEESPVEGPIALSGNWERIQMALDLSLTQLAGLDPSSSLVVNPFFGRPKELKTQFVLMPFDPAMKPLYEDHIRNAASKLKLRAARADDFFTSKSIMMDIWSAISGSRILIADCTGRNPNVFYEIGLAHTIGKPVILLTSDADDVPFDLRHFRFIKYEFTPRGMEKFEDDLLSTLKTEVESSQ